MKEFGAISRIQVKRAFALRYIVLWGAFFLVLLFLALNSISEYRGLLKSKQDFARTETERVRQYRRISRYGGDGIRLMFIPSPGSIFFDDSGAFQQLVSNVNTSDRSTIVEPLKGFNIFHSRSGLDIAGVLFLFSAFLGMFAGFDVKGGYLKFLFISISPFKAFVLSILARYITLIFSMLITVMGVSLIAKLFLESLKIPWLLILLLVLVILFFMALGAVVGSIKGRITQLIAIGALFYIFVLLLPGVAQKISSAYAGFFNLSGFELENQKLIGVVEKTLNSRFGTIVAGEDVPPASYYSEARRALDRQFKEIRERESKLLSDIRGKVRKIQFAKALIPSTFWDSAITEMSSRGFDNFLAFCQFSAERKKDFLYFYTERRFKRIGKRGRFQIESFIKEDENMFYASPRLPYAFPLGVGLTLFYTLLIFVAAYRLHIRRIIGPARETVQVELESPDQGFTFVLCENQRTKQSIISRYEQQEAVVLRKINPDDLCFPGVTPAGLFRHFCRVSGAREKTALENLAAMGVDPGTAGYNRETVLKMVAAIILARGHRLVVIDDFIKRESRAFEQSVFSLLERLQESGKSFVYLSTEIFQTTDSLDRILDTEKWGSWPIDDLKKITLR